MEYPFGMVLSGGGSRGLAHAGVLKALLEAGIQPACISGTSAGALVGALYAAGYDEAGMLDFFETTSPFRFSRLAIGKPGWFDGEKIAEDFRRFFPDDAFEALPCKLFVAATDLLRGRLEVFSKGPLIPALIASASVPVLFTPMPYRDSLFADGGIVDNFPVEPLSGLCDVILGVYASPLSESPADELDSSLDVSQRAIEIAMHFASKRHFHKADLVLSPPELSRYNLLDLRHHAEILDIGYQAAKARMPEIVALVEGGR
jgi:NTE family protein